VPTWTNIPFGLKGSNASEACHREEIEEYLRHVKDDSWFRNDHLGGEESIGARSNRQNALQTHIQSVVKTGMKSRKAS